jgi:hypothetical protein
VKIIYGVFSGEIGRRVQDEKSLVFEHAASFVKSSRQPGGVPQAIGADNHCLFAPRPVEAGTQGFHKAPQQIRESLPVKRFR